jgi:hypothetical protein
VSNTPIHLRVWTCALVAGLVLPQGAIALNKASFKRACEEAGGTYWEKRNGSFGCSYPELAEITCTKRKKCEACLTLVAEVPSECFPYIERSQDSASFHVASLPAESPLNQFGLRYRELEPDSSQIQTDDTGEAPAETESEELRSDPENEESAGSEETPSESDGETESTGGTIEDQGSSAALDRTSAPVANAVGTQGCGALGAGAPMLGLMLMLGLKLAPHGSRRGF